MREKKAAKKMAPFPESLGLGEKVKRETARDAYARGNAAFRRFLLDAEYSMDDRVFLAEVVDYLLWEAHSRNSKERPKAQPPYRPTRKPDSSIRPLAELSALQWVKASDRKAWVCEHLGGVKWSTLKKRIGRLSENDRTWVNELLGLSASGRIKGEKRARNPV